MLPEDGPIAMAKILFIVFATCMLCFGRVKSQNIDFTQNTKIDLKVSPFSR